MGERLGYGEAALGRAELSPEEGEGHVVGGLRSVRQGSGGLVQPVGVVPDQLARAPGRVVDRLAMPRVDDARRQLDRPLERGEVVAERIGPAVRVEADGRRDPAEEMVAADEDSVAQKAQVPVRVAGQLDHLPRLEQASLVQQLGVDGVADERGEGVALRDQVGDDRLRDAVPSEPLGDPLRPVLAPPDALALCVVEAALVHGSPGRGRGARRSSDVVRVKVGDGDPLDSRRAPRGVAHAEPCVEEGPVDEVAVDMLRPGRERKRQAADTVCK